MELRKIIKKKLNGMIFVIIMIAMLKGQVFAVSSEDLANPVRDVPTHSMKYERNEEGTPHKTKYCYVYFGSYPQREVSDTALINQLQNAKYDVNNDTSINGKKYRRMSWETMTSSGTIFGRSKEVWDETSYNGYRYYQYEPIKWKILSNDGEKLFLFVCYLCYNIFKPILLWTGVRKCQQTKRNIMEIFLINYLWSKG